jgi:hypothetical protein
MKRLILLCVPVLLVLVVCGIAAAKGFDPSAAPPPWSGRCKVAIRAYEDGSANLYCDGRKKPFGAIDAESGKIRFFMPH